MGEVHEKFTKRDSEEELWGILLYGRIVDELILLRGGRIRGGILGRSIFMEPFLRDIMDYCS